MLLWLIGVQIEMSGRCCDCCEKWWWMQLLKKKTRQQQHEVHRIGMRFDDRWIVGLL